MQVPSPSDERSPSSWQIATATDTNTKAPAAVILLRRNADHILASARRYFGFGDKNDYVVLGDHGVIGRIFRAPHSPEGHPWFWTITAKGHSPIYNRGYSTTREQAMADFKARWAATTNSGPDPWSPGPVGGTQPD
jgi:hypothetical protein